MKKLLLFCLLSCSTLSMLAQRYNWRTDAIKQAPNFIIKYDFGSILYSNGPFIQFNLEHIIKNNLYIEYGLGFVNRTPRNNFNFTNLVGYNTQAHLKYYLNGIVKESPNYFVGLHTRFNQTFSNRFDTFSLANGAFTRRYNYTRKKSHLGIYATFGMFAFRRKRIVSEVDFGIGYVILNRQNIGVPDDAVPINNNFGFWQPGFDDTPAGNSGGFRTTLGIRFGYVLIDAKK